MTKKHFIALADTIRAHNEWSDRNRLAIGGSKHFQEHHIEALADFCQSQNPQFNRDRWLGYIAGTNGKNGGRMAR